MSVAEIREEQRLLKETLPFYINKADWTIVKRYFDDSRHELSKREEVFDKKVDSIEERRESLEARIEKLENP
jgi:chaperonin cofactor prefoldin